METKMYDVLLEMFENTLEHKEETLQEDLLIKTNLAIDSLQFINFIVKVEEKYGVDLMDDFDEIEDITVRDLCIRVCELVDKKQKSGVCEDEM